jgi:hypothetical protein
MEFLSSAWGWFKGLFGGDVKVSINSQKTGAVKKSSGITINQNISDKK